jgi:hypothetical protein
VSDAAAKSIVTSFNDCITGISSLMTDDHVFIDTANNSISGKNCCLAAWKSFFAAFPNYRNIFHQVLIVGDHAVIVGHSVCGDRRLVGPALWTAKLSGTLVAEWRVYEDTSANRALLGQSRRSQRCRRIWMYASKRRFREWQRQIWSTSPGSPPTRAR